MTSHTSVNKLNANSLEVTTSSARAICNTCEMGDVTLKIRCGKCKRMSHPMCDGGSLCYSTDDINTGLWECQRCSKMLEYSLSVGDLTRVEATPRVFTTDPQYSTFQAISKAICWSKTCCAAKERQKLS